MSKTNEELFEMHKQMAAFEVASAVGLERKYKKRAFSSLEVQDEMFNVFKNGFEDKVVFKFNEKECMLSKDSNLFDVCKAFGVASNCYELVGCQLQEVSIIDQNNDNTARKVGRRKKEGTTELKKPAARAHDYIRKEFDSETEEKMVFEYFGDFVNNTEFSEDVSKPFMPLFCESIMDMLKIGLIIYRAARPLDHGKKPIFFNFHDKSFLQWKMFDNHLIITSSFFTLCTREADTKLLLKHLFGVYITEKCPKGLMGYERELWIYLQSTKGRNGGNELFEMYASYVKDGGIHEFFKKLVTQVDQAATVLQETAQFVEEIVNTQPEFSTTGARLCDVMPATTPIETNMADVMQEMAPGNLQELAKDAEVFDRESVQNVLKRGRIEKEKPKKKPKKPKKNLEKQFMKLDEINLEIPEQHERLQTLAEKTKENLDNAIQENQDELKRMAGKIVDKDHEILINKSPEYHHSNYALDIETLGNQIFEPSEDSDTCSSAEEILIDRKKWCYVFMKEWSKPRDAFDSKSISIPDDISWVQVPEYFTMFEEILQTIKIHIANGLLESELDVDWNMYASNWCDKMCNRRKWCYLYAVEYYKNFDKKDFDPLTHIRIPAIQDTSNVEIITFNMYDDILPDMIKTRNEEKDWNERAAVWCMRKMKHTAIKEEDGYKGMDQNNDKYIEIPPYHQSVTKCIEFDEKSGNLLLYFDYNRAALEQTLNMLSCLGCGNSTKTIRVCLYSLFNHMGLIGDFEETIQTYTREVVIRNIYKNWKKDIYENQGYIFAVLDHISHPLVLNFLESAQNEIEITVNCPKDLCKIIGSVLFSMEKKVEENKKINEC